MTHRIGAAIVGLVLVFGSTTALAQAVLQSVNVQVESGKMSDYMERVAALQGVMDRVGGGGKLQVWQATLAGSNTGNVLVAVSHPSLAAFAETTTKTAADPEWQKIIGKLDDVRTLTSSSLLVSRDGGGQPEPAGEGAVLQGVLVRVNPGRLDDYLAKLASLQKIQERLGTSAQTRAWQATLAGDGTGTVAVGITYPSLTAYAEDSGKLQADPEGQKLFAGLDDMRTVVSSSLFRSVGP